MNKQQDTGFLFPKCILVLSGICPVRSSSWSPFRVARFTHVASLLTRQPFVQFALLLRPSVKPVR